MPTYSVTVDGRTFDVSADTPELAARKAYQQVRLAEVRGVQQSGGALSQLCKVCGTTPDAGDLAALLSLWRVGRRMI
jgi:hypothetical protein